MNGNGVAKTERLMLYRIDVLTGQGPISYPFSSATDAYSLLCRIRRRYPDDGFKIEEALTVTKTNGVGPVSTTFRKLISLKELRRAAGR